MRRFCRYGATTNVLEALHCQLLVLMSILGTDDRQQA